MSLVAFFRRVRRPGVGVGRSPLHQYLVKAIVFYDTGGRTLSFKLLKRSLGPYSVGIFLCMSKAHLGL